MKKKSLYEQSLSQVITPVELVKTHQSLVREYFKFEEEEKPQILKDALRLQIEKIESKLI